MGHRSVLCRAGSLLLFPFFLAAAHAQESAVLGPVEQVNHRESSLTVLGQTYEVAPSVVVTIGATSYSYLRAFRSIRAGAYVSIVGNIAPSGRLVAQEILVSRTQYVAGASDVFISGVVTSYDASTGQAKVGNLVIDATPTFAELSEGIYVGSRIEVSGKQAVSGGVVWASGLEVLRAVDTDSISGTGSKTSTLSISGTGASMQSISGTGAGASMQSISGTGIRKQSISGTGAQTNMQSISGTGAQAFGTAPNEPAEHLGHGADGAVRRAPKRACRASQAQVPERARKVFPERAPERACRASQAQVPERQRKVFPARAPERARRASQAQEPERPRKASRGRGLACKAFRARAPE